MSSEIKYTELKNLIIKGCDDYLNLHVQKNTFWDKIWNRGEEGVVRAQKAKIHASRVETDSEMDHAFLLALLIAIFNSRANRLSMYIAHLLIQGEIRIIGAYENDYISTPVIQKDSLTSPVFSQKMVDAAKDVNLIETEDSPYGPELGADKKGCVRWILNNQAPKSTLFKSLTIKIQTDLDDQSSELLQRSQLLQP